MQATAWWREDDPTRLQAEVTSHPEVNATGGGEDEVRGYLAQSWNRTFPDEPLGPGDFELAYR